LRLRHLAAEHSGEAAGRLTANSFSNDRYSKITIISWPGTGPVAVGMHRQGFDLQLTQYDDRGSRATL